MPSLGSPVLIQPLLAPSGLRGGVWQPYPLATFSVEPLHVMVGRGWCVRFFRTLKSWTCAKRSHSGCAAEQSS